MNVVEYLHTAATSAPDTAALVAGIGRKRRCLSFAQLADRVDAVVADLDRCALRPGDRVLLAVPISSEMYVALLAILKAGLVVMYVDPAHGAAVAAHCLRSYPPAAIIGTRRTLWMRWLLPELRRIPKQLVVARAPGEGDGPARPRPIASRSLEDPALLTFTSGSTALPKPVLRTHGFLATQLDSLNAIARPEPHAVDLCAMPMFVLLNLANAITSVVPASGMQNPGRADPAMIGTQLHAERASRMVASPAVLQRLADHCLRNAVTFPELLFIATGGGPIDPALPARLRAIAPNANILLVYGSTEAEPIATIDAGTITTADVARMRSGGGLLVGHPVPGCRVAIVERASVEGAPALLPDEFAALDLPPGHIGEIIVSGAHVLRSYANVEFNAETKIEVKGTVWHRTGDAGYFDSLGRLWLVGRAAAGIHDARGSAFPFQIEYALSTVPGVERAALVACHGQRVLAIQAESREYSASGVIAALCAVHCEVDRIVRLDRIPLDRRHAAKVDYTALRSELDRRLQTSGQWLSALTAHGR